MSKTTPVLRIEELKVYFPVRSGIWSRVKDWVKAIDGVSLTVNQGETVGLVGESGCGKSSLARTVLRLYQPIRGAIYLGDSPNLATLSQRALRSYRRRAQMIFQDPFASLNPRMTVKAILEEPLIVFRLISGKARKERIKELLNRVGLNENLLNRYPHEFSGGQRQRICIARALAAQPDLIIADEPTAALDVSIQAQIINLLMDLKAQFGLSLLFISHDLSIIQHISDRVAVMYSGKIVEWGACNNLFSRPLHPYTQALLQAIPTIIPAGRKLLVPITGEPPSPLHPPGGCRFHPRCPKRLEMCSEVEPTFRKVGDSLVACHLY